MLIVKPAASIALLALVGVPMIARRSHSATSTPFDEALIYVEYNATDDDAEVVLVIDAEMGLERLAIEAPSGAEVLHLRAEHLGLGLRKFALETPEPSLQSVLAAYPAGEYRFYGRAVDGRFLFSVVTLSHALPAAPAILYPLDGDTAVPITGASAVWSAAPDADGFFLELENDDLGVDVKSNIAGGATTFGFPAGWLDGGTEYQLGVAARGGNGNLTVVEIDFTTAP